MEFLLAAISLGFLGSFHCIGMCGPIALALPVHGKSAGAKTLAILSYNGGRILTYAAFGAVMGMIGQSFAFFGYQQIFSVVLGALILAGLFLPRFLPRSTAAGGRILSLLSRIKQRMAKQFEKRGIRSFFSIGLLNGLLPCGLVYMGLAGAAASGTVLKGALFMAVFGAGTLPVMFAIPLSSGWISIKVRTAMRRTVPVFVGLMAVLLVLRGLNLGIAYVSPKLSENKTATCHAAPTMSCCHKK